MRVRIGRSGKGASIRVPASIMSAARLEIGQEVDVQVVDGVVVIGSPGYRRYDLDELVDGITPENRHDAVDFGNAVGREAR